MAVPLVLRGKLSSFRIDGIDGSGEPSYGAFGMTGKRIRQIVWLAPLAAVWLAGCGTTRWTDTRRTATEQMLVSDAIDRAVSRIDFRLLAGKEIFLDTAFLGETVDKEYLTSTLRQQLVSSGCILKEKREQAAFVVEARSGTIGTDRHDLLYGIPGFSLPTFSAPGLVTAPAVPSTFPEVAFAKRTDQKAVAKIAVFAYHRETGAPIWQSGADVVASNARDLWVFGAGPFQRGTIYDHTRFAGDDFHVPLVKNENADEVPEPVRVAQQRLFNSPNGFRNKPAAAVAVQSVDPSLPLLPAPFSQTGNTQLPPASPQNSANAGWDSIELASPTSAATFR